MTAQTAEAPTFATGELVMYAGNQTDFPVAGEVSGTPDVNTGAIYVNVHPTYGGGCIVVDPSELSRVYQADLVEGTTDTYLIQDAKQRLAEWDAHIAAAPAFRYV